MTVDYDRAHALGLIGPANVTPEKRTAHPDTIHGAAILAHLKHGEAVTVPATALDCAVSALKDAGLHESVTVTEVDGKHVLNLAPAAVQEPDNDDESRAAYELRWKGGYPQGMVDWYNEGADGAINWGSDGDFEDCVAIAGKYIDNPEGFCNLRHHDATGAAPGHAPGEGEDKSLADRFREMRGTINGKPTRNVALAERFTPKMVAAYKSGDTAQISKALKTVYAASYVAGLKYASSLANTGDQIGTAVQADPVLSVLNDDAETDEDDFDPTEDDDQSVFSSMPTSTDDTEGTDWASAVGLVSLMAGAAVSASNIVDYMNQDGTPDPETQAAQVTDSAVADGIETGTQDAAQAAGYTQMQSVPDDDACEVCQDKADDTYDIGDDGPPWHPRCSCESKVVGSMDDQENASAFGRHVRRWKEKRDWAEWDLEHPYVPYGERDPSHEEAGPKIAGTYVHSLASGEHTIMAPQDLPAAIAQMKSSDEPINLHNLQLTGEGNENLFDQCTLCYPRVQMPVISDTEDAQHFCTELAAGGIDATWESVDPRDLKATQSELDGVKVAGMTTAMESNNGVLGTPPPPVLVVDEHGSILDGHHRWAAAATYAVSHPGFKVDIVRVHTGIAPLVTLANAYDDSIPGHEKAKAFGQKAANILAELRAIQKGTNWATPPADAPPVPDATKPYLWLKGKGWLLMATDTQDGVPRELNVPASVGDKPEQKSADPTYEDRATPADVFARVEEHVRRGTLAWEERDWAEWDAEHEKGSDGMPWEDLQQKVKDTNALLPRASMLSGTPNPNAVKYGAEPSVGTTTNHPDTFYHVTDKANADDISANGMVPENHMTGKVFLSASPDDIPKADESNDVYKVDTTGIPLRPDPEHPDKWAIAETTIPPERVTKMAKEDSEDRATPADVFARVEEHVRRGTLAWEERDWAEWDLEHPYVPNSASSDKSVPTEYPNSHVPPVDYLQGTSKEYAEKTGIAPSGNATDFDSINADPVRGPEIGSAYTALPLDDPAAHASYDALASEVGKQYDYMTKDLGIKVDVQATDPYPSVKEMVQDVQNNHHIAVLSTETTGAHPYFTNEQNDQFRAVHDVFGHAATGRGFDRNGEEAAWTAHSQMFSPAARPAMTSETRGQNSAMVWGDGQFQPQKVALLPQEYIDRLLKMAAELRAHEQDTTQHDADADNLYSIGHSHHASNGRHFPKKETSS